MMISVAQPLAAYNAPAFERMVAEVLPLVRLVQFAPARSSRFRS